MPVQHVKNKPIIVGLTGGIATGKSTASKYLLSQGYKVIDSDAIVKELWSKEQPMLAEIESVFHTLNKRVIAESIFEDKMMRDKLNAIVHPYVLETIKQRLKALQDEKVIIIDMPLLFEVGYQQNVDYTAVVYAKPQTAKIRMMMRDGITDIDAEKRIAAQMSIDSKRHLADFVLDNTKDKHTLYKAIDRMMRSIINEEQFEF